MMTLLPTSSGAGLQLTVAGVPGAVYVIESSLNLTNWTAIHTQTNAPFNRTIATDVPISFFRMRIHSGVRTSGPFPRTISTDVPISFFRMRIHSGVRTN
jgi:hypothetical protein